MANQPQAVFVVDDDDVVRDSLKALLEARGFAVEDYGSGREFLAAGGAVACLLLDIHMPEMSGLDLLRQLRGQGDSTPVILMTGRRDPTTEDQAKPLGIIALLDKPLAPPALFAAIQEALAA